MVEAMNSTHNDDKQVIEPPVASLESPTKADRLNKRLEESHAKLASMTEKLQETELQLKVLQADSARQHKEMTVKIEELEQEKLQLHDQVRKYEMQKGAQIEDMESAWKQEVTKLEQEIEDKQSSYERELSEIQKKSEESLAQLKNFYELEKENLESRIREEREKSMARLA